MKLDRRRFLGSSVSVAATVGMTAEWAWPKHSVSYRRPRSAVAVLTADEHSEKIEVLLLDGLRLFRLNVLGKTVLLKPNLVEDLPGPVNTSTTLVGAAARSFLRLGAARMAIGERPGHQRDTDPVIAAINGSLRVPDPHPIPWTHRFKPQRRERFPIAQPEDLHQEFVYAKEGRRIELAKAELQMGPRRHMYEVYTRKRDVTRRLESNAEPSSLYQRVGPRLLRGTGNHRRQAKAYPTLSGPLLL
jgi:hypothetical protein